MDASTSAEQLALLRSMVESEPDLAGGLDDRCLLLTGPDELDDWSDCPPRPGEPFAQDGSEHEYCLLEDGTVVLYSPLAATPYLVVGADLRDFLALLLTDNGAGVGGLAYDYEDTVAELSERAAQDDDDEAGDGERAALARLAEAFSLVPWPDHRTRLHELSGRLPARLR